MSNSKKSPNSLADEVGIDDDVLSGIVGGAASLPALNRPSDDLAGLPHAAAAAMADPGAASIEAQVANTSQSAIAQLFGGPTAHVSEGPVANGLAVFDHGAGSVGLFGPQDVASTTPAHTVAGMDGLFSPASGQGAGAAMADPGLAAVETHVMSTAQSAIAQLFGSEAALTPQTPQPSVTMSSMHPGDASVGGMQDGAATAGPSAGPLGPQDVASTTPAHDASAMVGTTGTVAGLEGQFLQESGQSGASSVQDTKFVPNPGTFPTQASDIQQFNDGQLAQLGLGFAQGDHFHSLSATDQSQVLKNAEVWNAMTDQQRVAYQQSQLNPPDATAQSVVATTVSQDAMQAEVPPYLVGNALSSQFRVAASPNGAVVVLSG